MELLPQSIRDMADVIGATAALALVRAYAGRQIKVPKGLGDSGVMRFRLVSIMGENAAVQFMRNYGGQVMAVPRCLAVLLAQRNAGIIADYDNGKTAATLAAEHQLTMRQIFKILKQAPEANIPDACPRGHNSEDQMALF